MHKRILAVVALVVVGAAKLPAQILNNTNIGAVLNCPPGPACQPQFVLAAPTFISEIDTYHWNNAHGDSPAGTISLRNAAGNPFGPFAAQARPATNNVLANWVAPVNRVLPAGTYTVIDSHQATWSQNTQSGGKGFTIVRGTVGAALTPIGPGAVATPTAAPAPVPCTFRNGFQFLCYGQVITVVPNPVVIGTPVTFNVLPASGYSFDSHTVIVLEPSGGVGFGVGLRTLCGATPATACPVTGPKTLTVPVPATGIIPPGTYLVRAENWEPATVVAGVGICTPTCTEADAGFVRFGTTSGGGISILSVQYPVNGQQIAVDFMDPSASINRIEVRPWTGYQWGPGTSWDPHVGGMAAGRLFISVGGCTPGRSYTVYITLFNGTGQASQQFTYKC